MFTSVVTRKGQITIPVQLRRRLGIEEGTVVAFAEQHGEIVVRPVESSIEAAFGLVEAKRTASLEDFEAATRTRGTG